MLSAILLLLVLSLALGVLAILLYITHLHRKYGHIPGPPRHGFLLGHTTYLIKRFKEDRTGFAVVLEYLDLYGPIFVLWFALKPQVLVTEPETIKDTIVSNVHGKLDKRAEARLFGERFVGTKSIFVNTGDEIWRRNRRAYNKYFSRTNMRHYHELVTVVAHRLTEQLAKLAGTGVLVDMNHWLNISACDIIGLVAFNWDINSVSRDDSTFASHLDKAFTGVTYATGRPLSWIAPQFKQIRGEARSAVRELRRCCAEQIQIHKTRLESEDPPEPCLLDEILGQSPDNQEFQIDEMLAMFVAGQETVAHVTTFALCHAMRDPAIVDQVEREVQEYMSDPMFETLAGLVKLDNLMKETLRHYAPVPGLRRILSKDTDICGYLVPKDTEIVHVMVMYAHNENVWGSDHMEFNPARFDNSTFSISKRSSPTGLSKRTQLHNDRNRHPHAFIPFGIGPRVCIGRELARIEFKILIAHLLSQFKFTAVEGECIQPMRYTSVKPMSGYTCYVDLHYEDITLLD